MGCASCTANKVLVDQRQFSHVTAPYRRWTLFLPLEQHVFKVITCSIDILCFFGPGSTLLGVQCDFSRVLGECAL